jgi:predicted phosphate transport protein (TIGR00153 family)
MLIFKKEKHVRKLVLEHASVVHECVAEARGVFEEYVAGDRVGAKARAETVWNNENRGDELKREIRDALHAGAFLPQIRSDVYRLVDVTDGIAGQAEYVTDFLMDQLPDIPAEYEADLLEIFSLCVTSYHELRKAMKDFFKPKGQLEYLHGHVARVGELETEVDEKESDLTRRIFRSSLGLSEKIHLSMLITEIGTIADMAEDVADELESAAMRSII